ncbi:hypothetical protein EDD52_11510 [Primorskyibacter sedentarius]|uniref:Uncharacterized protein n=1 Tax=Primorskyibacter sedentarius TaxID=745311 RepID=A0A4R3J5S4_9RHOB|nr:hypothetical protein [Primorskyibacter sedentarius]TCS60193.1 hypothetical protein EDD52_11510 [Primorskyibacter sedentarius]
MELPCTSADELTTMAASCFPLARAAATGIEQDVLDLIAPAPKREAKKLAARLQSGAIFEKGILAMLHEIVGVLDSEIVEGTYVETCYDHSPENVSENQSWSRERLTPDAERLTSALAVLNELYATLSAVHDVLRAEKALEEMRAAA